MPATNYQPLKKPIIIAHRGASGFLPEHTLLSYLLAIEQGADFIEPDLVMTQDGHLIARHDNILNLTTDVSERAEFQCKKTTKSVDGIEHTGWFSEDFTLEEIKILRAKERIPHIRPQNARFDNMLQIPTFEEIVGLIKTMEQSKRRQIGIYPETKHPTHFKQLGFEMEETLVDILNQNNYTNENDQIFIQSFEISNLKQLKKLTRLPLIQLLDDGGQPFDTRVASDRLSYDQMATTQGLKEIATYAAGIGPEKNHFIVPKDEQESLQIDQLKSLINDAHQADLLVHPYTFRAENSFLPNQFKTKKPTDPNVLGQLTDEIKLFLELGIDGFFTDQPNLGLLAKTTFLENH